MKRRLLPIQLKKGLLVIPAAAMMLGAASHGAQIGINFADNWGGTPYGTLTDSAGAFGIPLANWYNAPMVSNSGAGGGVGTNGTFAVPGGGDLQVTWSCKNTYSLYAAVPTAGDNQIIYGYLDDTDYGYKVKLTGLRAFASSFTIKTIAATDSGTDFMPVSVYSATDTNTLEYLANYTPSFAGGLAGDSTVSPAFATLSANDSVTIQGFAKTNSSIRSCLAGIVITYTPAANNPPLVEADPQPPVGLIFPGGSFSLASQASGAPTLHYQWRKGGTEIPGANFANYTNSSVAIGDTGAYDVVVTNAFGAVTSAVAQVTIQNVVAPVITQAPVSQNLYQGYPATFTVAATGGQLTYQWKSNNVAVPGATSATFSIASVTSSSAGTYTVEVNNPVGPMVSASATLAVKVPVPGSYEAVVAQTKPLVWFRESETTVPQLITGSAANSGSTGSADNGVAKRYVSFQQPGALVGDANKSAELNSGRTGNDGKVIDIPYDAALNPTTFTAELWVKPAEVIGTSARSPLYNRGAVTADGFLFFAHNGTTKWSFRTYAGATGRTISSTVDVTPGVWTHLVGVYDGTTGIQKFYVNGVQQGTDLNTGGGFTPNTSVQMRLGGRNDIETGANLLLFKGGIDEVAIYDTALSASDILAHYENGTNTARSVDYATLVQASAPVGYWRMNDPAGPTAPFPANSGTLGTAWNGAYAFDVVPGTVGPRPPTEPGLESTNVAMTAGPGYGHIGAPICPDLNVNTVTVAGWIKRSGAPSYGDLGWPVWLGDGGMHIENTSGRPQGELRYHWKGNYWGWGSGLVVPSDVWTFVAMVVEPTKATFYMSDGLTLKSSVNTVAHAPLAVYSPLGFAGNQPDRADRNYLGQEDEFAVYNRALTQSEINALFMVGTGAPLVVGIVPGGMIEDSKPVGTPHQGANYLTTWLASSTDVAAIPVTRTGVEVFSTANNSQIKVDASPDFDSTTGTFTFWMKADAPVPGPGNEGAIIFDRRTTSGAVIVLNDAGNIFVQCSGGANSFAGGYLPDGNWHHVAVTYDQSASGSIEIFVDGASQGTQANTAAWAWPTTQAIELGRSHDSYWKRYDGQMDDFRIYNRVLTAGEITSVFTSDALVDTAALKLRYNFGTAGIGNSVTWPFGTLLSSPTLGPTATWTPVPGAALPAYPFLPTEPARFFRAAP